MGLPHGAGTPLTSTGGMVQPSFISQVKRRQHQALILTVNMAPAEPVARGTFRRENLTSADNEKMAGVGANTPMPEDYALPRVREQGL